MKRIPAAKIARRSCTIRSSPSTRTSGGPTPPHPHAPSDSLLVVRPVRPSVTDGRLESGMLGLPGQDLGVDHALGSLIAQVGRSGVGRVSNGGVDRPRCTTGGV